MRIETYCAIYGVIEIENEGVVVMYQETYSDLHLKWYAKHKMICKNNVCVAECFYGGYVFPLILRRRLKASEKCRAKSST